MNECNLFTPGQNIETSVELTEAGFYDRGSTTADRD